jgi:hypothetical protein
VELDPVVALAADKLVEGFAVGAVGVTFVDREGAIG